MNLPLSSVKHLLLDHTKRETQTAHVAVTQLHKHAQLQALKRDIVYLHCSSGLLPVMFHPGVNMNLFDQKD